MSARSAREQAIYDISRNCDEQGNPNPQGLTFADYEKLTGFGNRELKNALHDASARHRTEGNEFAYPCGPKNPHYLLLIKEGARWLPCSDHLKATEKGLRNRRLAGDKWAVRHKAGMSLSERQEIQTRVDRDEAIISLIDKMDKQDEANAATVRSLQAEVKRLLQRLRDLGG